MMMTGDMSAALNLTDDCYATAEAARSGNWSDPNTWQNGVVPSANANVVIPEQVAVTLDQSTAAIHWILIDGTLQFASNADTNLVVDTAVVDVGGSLVIGTASDPISSQHRAAITFTANGPIDTTWDPNLLSRGLISMGNVSMYGAATTPYVALAGNALRGTTTLTLAQPPANWHAGDEVVLAGTFAKWNQDEDLRIASMRGTQITLSTPLAYDHTASNGVPVYITDLTRNIVLQSQDPSIIGNRGHVMFMSNATNIHYAEFLQLGRTDKSVPINSPQLDANGALIPGTGTNARGRYAVHFHRVGTDPNTAAAVVDGSSVVGSPGWGYVNHSSYVNFTNDVAFDVSGASFVSEAGDEIGSFSGDMAIHSLGTGAEDFYDPSRVPLQDWGHEGDGFWMQGNGVSVTNNIAIGQAAAGFYYFIKPFTAPLQDVVPSTTPLTHFSANLAEGCHYGTFLRYETNGGTVENLTVVNCITGYKQQYCTRITIQNSHLFGSDYSDFGIFLPVEAAQGFVAKNDVVSGFPVGILFSEEYNQTVIGGIWNNHHNMEIPTSIMAGRRITISNPIFTPNATRGHYDIYWLDQTEDVLSRNINAFFGPDIVTYNSQELFAPWQQASYIPFPRQVRGTTPLPRFLIGKTNAQLFAAYGLAMGGTLAPSQVQSSLRTNGTVGAVITFPTVVSLSSPWRSNALAGYRLSYSVNNGRTNGSKIRRTLADGWNTIIVTVNAVPHALFVLGGA
jgi:hypothetical protein